MLFSFFLLLSIAFYSPDLLGSCFPLSCLHLFCTLSKHQPEPSPVFNMGACHLIRESFPVCPEHCRQPVSPSTPPSTLPTHTHPDTHVSTSPPLTGRCHSGRQLQSLVWRLSSNQRPSSLSTATWPRGYHCHTAYTPSEHTHANTHGPTRRTMKRRWRRRRWLRSSRRADLHCIRGEGWRTRGERGKRGRRKDEGRGEGCVF